MGFTVHCDPFYGVKKRRRGTWKKSDGVEKRSSFVYLRFSAEHFCMNAHGGDIIVMKRASCAGV